MTTVYFIRHAQANNSVRDGRIRPLTDKGMNDRALVTAFLQDKDVDAVLCSPFKRAIDTITDFAEKNNIDVEIIEDFRERRSDIDFTKETFGFKTFMERQWADFTYTYSDGECLADVQNRNIAALNSVLSKYKDKNIVIGTHGTALSAIINYYDPTYSFADFMEMIDILPWVVKMDFNDDGCISIEKIDLFNPVTALDFNHCIVRTTDIGALKAYKFVVVFSRYQEKWLYCRAKERDCYETAGGHVESGETSLKAAKRELYEETGAVKFDIKPAFDYSAHFPNFYNTGQVYFAQIHELGDMPQFEMAEVKLFDSIPEKMRFPTILPILYDRLQGWIKTKNSKDELWDGQRGEESCPNMVSGGMIMGTSSIFDIKSTFDDPRVLEVFSSCMYMPNQEKLMARATLYMNDDRIYIYGYKIDGHIAGVVVFHLDSDNIAEIKGIATLREYRKIGVGHKLIKYAMNILKVSELYAETDDDAVGFYRNCGFEIEDLGCKYENCRRYKCILRTR